MRGRLAAALALAALLAWRVAVRPPAELWRDLPAVLAAAGLAALARRGADAGLPAAAYVCGLGLASQAPRILDLFR